MMNELQITLLHESMKVGGQYWNIGNFPNGKDGFTLDR
jgi:hypothetical protein